MKCVIAIAALMTLSCVYSLAVPEEHSVDERVVEEIKDLTQSRILAMEGAKDAVGVVPVMESEEPKGADEEPQTIQEPSITPEGRIIVTADVIALATPLTNNLLSLLPAKNSVLSQINTKIASVRTLVAKLPAANANGK